MIDTMTLLEEFTLIIVGSGDIEEKLRLKVNSLKLNDRIHFKGRVSPEQLPALTREACIGLSLEEDLGLNYRYALPNKVFDYIHAGIPTIVSDLPVMGTFVRENKIGEVLTQRDPKGLALLVKSVFENKEKYSRHIVASVEKYNWQNEKKEFLRLIENLE